MCVNMGCPSLSKYRGSLAPVELVEACGTSSECVECLALRQTFSKCPFFPQPLHTVSKALQSCVFWCLPLPHL